ncbi:MAG: sugar ABC transporter substrate-binding protein [Solirubrobacterales bacterium]
MRSKFLRVLLLVTAIALVGFVVACGGDDDDDTTSGDTTTEDTGGEEVAAVEFTGSLEEGVPNCYEEPSEDSLTIGFANPLDANETVNFERRAIQLEIEALGGEILNLDAEGDVDKQVSDVEQMIAQEVDAIIAFPLDAEALRPVLENAQEAGIPTVGIEADLTSTDPGAGYDTQVWQQRDRMSYLQAQAAAEIMEPGAEFAQIGFAVAVPTIEFQIERAGFWGEEFGLVPGNRADNPSDDIAGGEEAMTEILGTSPDVGGLIAYNEESATGANAATRQQGVDIPLVGNNGGSLGFDSVSSGAIDATVQIPVPDVGRCAVWGAYDLVQGVDVPPTVLAGEPALITAETIDTVTPWEDTLNERYGKTE